MSGVCQAGTYECEQGQLACVQVAPAAAETCDSLDNDCNGAVDDDLGSTTCGTGQCQNTVQNCVGGVSQTCTPGTPSPETCDGLDNDCDGALDESLGTTTCGTGQCQNTVQNCVGGVPQTCTPGAQSAEVCDGLDNDCDGTVDEGLGSTTCGIGQCQNTVQNCIGGQPQTCTPGTPSAEVCDGVDNDCNGSVDEGLGSTTCGTTGQCENTVQNCVGGQPHTCIPGTPSAETCDTIDNDCDGLTDEGCSNCVVANGLTWCYNPAACGEACNAVCASQGLLPVANNAVWFAAQNTVAECQAIANAFAIGAVNVGDFAFACLEDQSGQHSVGGGLTSPFHCSTSSTCPNSHRTNMDQLGIACGPGSRRSICPCEENCGPGTPSTEVCDGIDNDCDGTVDDGLGTTTCGTGQCQRTVQNCAGGVAQTCTPGTASAEICDGVDNDCDGTTDEACTNCLVVNGLTWCYNPAACGEACNAVCASQGLLPVADNAVWFEAQNTVAECQAIANAFAIGTVNVGGFAYACLEDQSGQHSVGGGLTSPFHCSTSSTCPNSHRTNMDQLGIACGPGSRRSICPCE